jgi:hypothetical protein
VTGVLVTAALALALLLAGCSMGNTEDLLNLGQEFWGEWVRMDTGDRWYITHTSVTVDGGGGKSGVSLAKQSERVIEVSEGERKYYLYASRPATSTFSGRIVGFDSASPIPRSAASGAGGRKPQYQNTKNPDNKGTAETAQDGSFTVGGTIAGDTYAVTVDGSTTYVTPNADGDDIGTITLVSGAVNFKTSIVPVSDSTDMNELFTGKNYSFNLSVQNTGTADCLAATYILSADEDITLTSSDGMQNIFKTIEPGVKKTVPITVSCPASAIPVDKVFKNIRITITDVSGQTWEDSVSLKFHKAYVHFYIRSEDGVSGILITPTGKTYSFTNTTNTTIDAPYLAEDYLLVFSGATAATETRYSFAVDAAPGTGYASFMDLGIYEPNNTEDAATLLERDASVMAYLHKNDVDYFRIRMSGE